MGFHERTFPDAAAPHMVLLRASRPGNRVDREGRPWSAYNTGRRVERTAQDAVQRLTAELAAARTEARRAEAERHRLAVENARLHAGYADALDRCAALMIERDRLTAQIALLRAARDGGARG